MENYVASLAIASQRVRGHHLCMEPFDYAHKTALVTGASTGIGLAFARALARRGASLILVARDQARLEAVARELPGARVIALDLTAPGAIARLHAETGPVDLLINNAGFGAYGEFAREPLATATGQIELNVRALVELSHAFLPEIARRRGGVIHVASTAAFQPVPYMAVYAASKAFVLSFSEALWGEYRGRGVRVLALCPGATDTQFFERAGEAARFGSSADPVDVVACALGAFERDRPSVVYGAGNMLTASLGRFFSRAFIARTSARLMSPARRLPAGGARLT
jgi:uncharacterized protein